VMSISRAKIWLVGLLGIAVLMPASTWAQVYSGSLTGLVMDPSEAIVPSVDVKLTDVDKGYSYTARTNEAGRYLLRSLPPGTYRLTATAVGFKLSVLEGIVLDVNQNTSLDIHLEVGQPQESVQVLNSLPCWLLKMRFKARR